MVYENELGRHKEELQSRQQIDKRHMSLQNEWGVANISEGTMPGVLGYKRERGEMYFKTGKIL